jgi:hypothetical protein
VAVLWCLGGKGYRTEVLFLVPGRNDPAEPGPTDQRDAARQLRRAPGKIREPSQVLWKKPAD